MNANNILLGLGGQGIWAYDPVADSWTQKASFEGAARSKAVGFAIGTKGYLATGANGGACFDDLWDFDPMVY